MTIEQTHISTHFIVFFFFFLNVVIKRTLVNARHLFIDYNMKNKQRKNERTNKQMVGASFVCCEFYPQYSVWALWIPICTIKRSKVRLNTYKCKINRIKC